MARVVLDEALRSVGVAQRPHRPSEARSTVDAGFWRMVVETPGAHGRALIHAISVKQTELEEDLETLVEYRALIARGTKRTQRALEHLDWIQAELSGGPQRVRSWRRSTRVASPPAGGFIQRVRRMLQRVLLKNL